MIYAAYFNQPQIIDFLVSLGFSIDKTGKNEDSALIRACYYKRFDAARKLLELGANPNIKNQDYPLMQAMLRDSAPMAQLLLDFGADINLIANRINQEKTQIPKSILEVFNQHLK